ncbi:MAG: UbiA family prenyltransferase [Armatimonadota bacterium]|nr:MAG: UbiA family prenyltransferase [Armatimonadota bacterium]
MVRKAISLLNAIGFEHAASALPFALSAAFVASYGWPRVRTLSWILVAMVGARTAWIAFGRIAGLDRERRDPGTAGRTLLARDLGTHTVWLVLIVAAAAYFLGAAMLNRLCLVVSPFALAAVLVCSYSNRRTVITHWILGFCLGLAPVGAWIAVRGRIDLPAIILGAAAMFWAAGFDIIRSCRDIAFHRAHKLCSLPARWGARRALLFAAANHMVTVWLLALFGEIAELGWLYLLGVVLLVPVLFWAHRLVRPDDLSRVETVHLLADGVFSVILFLFAAADVMLIGGRMRI